MKFFYLMALVSISSVAHAQKLHERIELMKYAMKAESAVRHETELTISWFRKFSLIDKAYAYKEGESCLVLGFKSQFKNGMCRLVNAEGLQDYKKNCSSGLLPCNPQVFGKPTSDQPFCISAKKGKELSRACAEETFTHLAKKSKSPLLTDLKNLNLDKLDISHADEALTKAFNEIFGHADSTIESAISFTKNLCEDLKSSSKSGHQPLDLRTCERHLVMLEAGNKPIQETVESAKTILESGVTAEATNEEECIEPVLDKKTSENIQDAQIVTTQTDAQEWLSCINKIEAHKIVAKQLAGIAEHDKERDRYFGYWHKLDNEKQFGKLCENSSTESNAVFSFVGPKGFSTVNVPATTIKNNINRVSSQGKEYFIVRDMLGDYFEFYSKDKVSLAPAEAQEDIKVYTKKGGGAISVIGSVPTEKLPEAKLCLRERIDEYLNWITYPYGILPSVQDYNKDVGIINGGGDVKAKYSRTVEQIKKDQFSEVMKDLPDCKNILSEESFSKQYDKDHEERIRLYNKMRSNLKM